MDQAKTIYEGISDAKKRNNAQEVEILEKNLAYLQDTIVGYITDNIELFSTKRPKPTSTSLRMTWSTT